MKSKKSWAIVLTAICAIAVSVAATAMAHTKTFGGSMSLSLGSDLRFRGNLNSPHAACEKNRYINIYGKNAGGTYGSASFARTKDNGSFVSPTGFYYAGSTYKAVAQPKTVLKNGRHTHKCKTVTKVRPGREPE